LSAPTDVSGLLARHGEGTGWGALARAITQVENSPPWQVELPPVERPVHVVGITGPPGAGKSTLTGRLIEAYAKAGKRVGVLAIDPSSPISGGAVLGDRLRMETHLLGRDDVFVRSLASRGSHGAIAGATRNVARLLELSGSFDVILIETVGAGQTEVAIAELADTIALVTVPGLGDAVQAIKAGLMEVADMVVVNMADRPGTPETVKHLRLTLGRELPIATTIATEGTGVEELRALFDARWSTLDGNGDLAGLRERKRAREAALIAEAFTRACATEMDELSPDLNTAVKDILEEAARRWTT
jgi:LAO/AO transport system kinase